MLRDPEIKHPGHCLGLSYSAGKCMVFHLLTNIGSVMTRSTVVYLLKHGLNEESNKIRMADFTKSMESILGNYSHATSKLIEYKHDDPYSQIFEGDDTLEDNIQYTNPNNMPYHVDFSDNNSANLVTKYW